MLPGTNQSAARVLSSVKAERRTLLASNSSTLMLPPTPSQEHQPAFDGRLFGGGRWVGGYVRMFCGSYQDRLPLELVLHIIATGLNPTERTLDKS